MKSGQTRRLAASATIAILFATLLIAGPTAALADGTEYGGNPNCATFDESWNEGKVEPPADGTYNFGGVQITIDVYTVDLGQVFDWTSNTPIEAVIVKGGPNSLVYFYDPAATGDSGLHAPINPTNGQYPGLSHIAFCWGEEPPTTTTTVQDTTTTVVETTTTVEQTTTTVEQSTTTTVPQSTTTTIVTSTTRPTSTTAPPTSTTAPPTSTTVPPTSTTVPPTSTTLVGALGNYIWFDEDGDGEQDGGELPVPGVSVDLLDDEGNVLASDVTDVSGFYLFEGLEAGTYQVRATAPIGFGWTVPDASDDATDSDILASADDDAVAETGLIALGAGEVDLTWDGGLVVLVGGIQVTTTTQGNNGTLPFTGIETESIAGLGLALAGLGVLFLAFRRREDKPTN